MSECRRGKRQHVPHASIILIESYGTISASCLQACLDLLMPMTSGWIQRYCRQSAPVVKPRFASAQNLLQRPETSRRSRSESIGKRCFCVYEPNTTQTLQSSKFHSCATSKAYSHCAEVVAAASHTALVCTTLNLPEAIKFKASGIAATSVSFSIRR